MKWIKTFESFGDCPVYDLSDEIINYVKRFNTDEELLRSGGIPITLLDRLAFGFNTGIQNMNISDIKIIWNTDYEQAKVDQKESGLSKLDWAKTISFESPIEVKYIPYKKGFIFSLEDGHHRFYAAQILGMEEINVDLSIDTSIKPLRKITGIEEYNYDKFHRCVFKQVKNNI